MIFPAKYTTFRPISMKLIHLELSIYIYITSDFNCWCNDDLTIRMVDGWLVSFLGVVNLLSSLWIVKWSINFGWHVFFWPPLVMPIYANIPRKKTSLEALMIQLVATSGACHTTAVLFFLILPGWWFGTCFIFLFIYGMSSFPLTNSIIFQDGYCTTNQLLIKSRSDMRNIGPSGESNCFSRLLREGMRLWIKLIFPEEIKAVSINPPWFTLILFRFSERTIQSFPMVPTFQWGRGWATRHPADLDLLPPPFLHRCWYQPTCCGSSNGLKHLDITCKQIYVSFRLYIYILVGGFTHCLFSISYMGCHPSHWRTHIFQDG